MTHKIFIGIKLSLLVALLTLGYLYRDQIRTVAELQLEITQYAQTIVNKDRLIERQYEELERVSTLLLLAEEQKRETREMYQTLKELVEGEADEEVNEWLDSSIPDRLFNNYIDREGIYINPSTRESVDGLSNTEDTREHE